jgi:peptidoglycan/xylan/chitin deacetylase (PgdA/CDA1 family)
MVTRLAVAVVAAVATIGVVVDPGEPAVAATYGQFCRSGYPIQSVATSQRVVAFTFDDGPWPQNTEAVMSTFERYGWTAAFFMIGENASAYPSIARAVANRGFMVANHSMTHRYSVSTIISEIAPTNARLQAITGVRPTMFRAPGLTASSSINNAVYANGMCNVTTGSDLGDWRSPRSSASTLCARFKFALRPGAIILLHDGGTHKPTIAALPCMLDYARAQGYVAVDLGDLLAGVYSTGKPSAPRALAATVGSGRVGLTWTGPIATGGAPITDYVVKRSSDRGLTRVSLHDDGSTRTTYTATGLTDGATYQFRVEERK